MMIIITIIIKIVIQRSLLFEKRLRELFPLKSVSGIVKAGQVIAIFNQVELNAVFFSITKLIHVLNGSTQLNQISNVHSQFTK